MKRFILTMLVAVAYSALPADSQSPFRSVPHAKTQQELNDYNTAELSTGGAALEAAANDFAAKYPESELRTYLYSRAMHAYQSENNPGKILATGERVLAVDPDNSVALALSATVLADGLQEKDPDRDQKAAIIKRDCSRALDSLESSMVLAPGVTPEEIPAYKASLGIMVHSALGIMELKTGNDSGAEKDLKAALRLNRVAGDATVYYHLALAQDHQKKYSDAMGSVEQALQLASSNPELQKLAEEEHERLQKLTGRRSTSGQSSSH
jgi:tetratricopeptide (TPR) repeat protein